MRNKHYNPINLGVMFKKWRNATFFSLYRVIGIGLKLVYAGNSEKLGLV
jgi:hypothetical protein